MATNDNDFSSHIPAARVALLCDLGCQLGFDPLSSLEIESYFSTVLGEAERAGIREDDLPDWLLRRIAPDFQSVAANPRWIQTDEWPISEGRPMVFIGQIDVAPTPGLTGRHTSFFLFLDPRTWQRKTVVQDS